MFRRRFGSLGEARSHMLWMSMIFTAYGITLIVQPGRYANTPAYGNLLEVFSQTVWGVLYLAGAVSAVLSFLLYRRKVLVYVGLFAAGMVLLSWWLAFDTRYVTDKGTTIANVLSWGTYLYLIVRSAITVDDAPNEIEVP
jgi:hypothetical protein